MTLLQPLAEKPKFFFSLQTWRLAESFKGLKFEQLFSAMVGSDVLVQKHICKLLDSSLRLTELKVLSNKMQ